MTTKAAHDMTPEEAARALWDMLVLPYGEAAAAGSAVFETTSTNVSDLLSDVRLVA
jgi:hypothetical protein